MLPARAALRQMVLDFPGLPERAVGAIIASVDRETAAQNGWTFVMLSPAQNEAVLNWLLDHSSRPHKVVPGCTGHMSAPLTSGWCRQRSLSVHRL